MAGKSKSTIRNKAAQWDAEVAKIKSQLEASWLESEFKLESLWHESAIAALRWIAGHRSRVSGLRQAVRGTAVEKALDTALAALRSEAKAPAPRRRKATKAAKAPRASSAKPAMAKRKASRSRSATNR